MRAIYWIFIFAIFGTALCKKRHQSSEEEEEAEQSAGEKIVDRLAVNLAGAFVKSMFPEMERSTSPSPAPQLEVRRAPPNYGGLNADLANYTPESVMSTYNAIPQMSQMNPANPFGYQSQLPYKQPNIQEAQAAVGVPNIPSLLTAGSGSPEAVNAVRNQQYLAQLAKHQSEVNAYSAKQLEYLENQRRYQQAMIDHQAGAALLMQQQQQEAINKQMESMKSSYGTADHHNDDNTVGGKVLTQARGVKTHELEAPIEALDDDVNTNDAHLKKFFKQQYGIDISENGDNLSEDEKETLRQLKTELLKNKENVIDRGTFKTMENLKGKLEKGKNNQRMSPPRRSSSERLASAPREGESCPQCIRVQMKMLRGAWTQMYGNPAVLKKTYGTIMSLSQASLNKGKTTSSGKKISCIGMEFGRSSRDESSLNIFYREDTMRNKLHEMRGTAVKEDDVLQMDTDSYNTKMCLVKVGPAETDRYEYIVLAETEGKNACRSYHVFARNTDEFNRRHFDDVSEFMKSEVLTNDILPVAAIPKSSLCQLDRP